MTEEQIKKYTYTKDEVNELIAEAVAQAHEADRIIMAKHNRDATIISMILGFICLALFVDGLLRILGIIPPFMDLDVNVIDDVIDRVESDLMPIIQDTAQKAQKYIPGR
jgi:AAA15 family ATPase/GTPase